MFSSSITASDGCKLAFQSSLPVDFDRLDSIHSNARYSTLILLIHGFSGSSEYFKHNVPKLSESSWVIAIDLRGHGLSGRSQGGYHVARLATDLQELVRHLEKLTGRQAIQQQRQQQHSNTSQHEEYGSDQDRNLWIMPVGCSIGAAVLWTYIELFSDRDFSALVFVDQAPLQDRTRFGDWDVSKAHRGCYDEASMLAAQKAWVEEPESAFKGLVQDCLGYRYAPLPGEQVSEEKTRDDEEFFTSQSRRCDTRWLARLLSDHTRYDHREACESINVPIMVMVGKRTGCFPLEGMRETVRRVGKGWIDRGRPTRRVETRWVEFESGHWLFWEEPARFNEEVQAFIKDCRNDH